MPLYVADYLRDTRRLTTAEHGAYLLLIMEYWTTGGLPDDDSQLARIVGMSAAEWRKAKPTIQAFFQNGWQHHRIDAEIAKAEAKHERRTEAGKRGGIAKANSKQNPSNATGNATSNALASSSQPQRKDAAGAALTVVPEIPPFTAAELEKSYFDRGKEVLGKNAGGLLKNLLKAKENSVALARAAIEQASTKSDPREYIGRIISGQKPGETAWLGGIEGVI